jgi:hypothetical protein
MLKVILGWVCSLSDIQVHIGEAVDRALERVISRFQVMAMHGSHSFVPLDLTS